MKKKYVALVASAAVAISSVCGVQSPTYVHAEDIPLLTTTADTASTASGSAIQEEESDIVISYELVTDGDGLLYQCKYEDAVNENEDLVCTVRIGANVKKIGSFAFSGLAGLDEVVCADDAKLELIDYQAFASCISLEHVVLPDTLKTIGKKAFNDCVKLSTIEVPESVTLIEECAFPVGCVVIAKQGSYAETYAKTNGYSYAYSVDGQIFEGDGTGGVDTSDTKQPVISPNTTTTKVAQAKLVSVKKKSKTSATVKFKKVSGATGYVISYATDKNFKKAKTVTTKKTTYVLKKLKKGKTYYVKVRAYKTVNKKKVYGKYSASKKVSLK